MADNPIHIPAVFAVNGLKNVIQKSRQFGQAIQDFTWVDGTPAVTMIDKADGGLAPKGQDFNGVMNAICEHTVFGQSGGRYKWSQDVIDNYGGYPSGAIVQSDDETREFRSLADNNTQNPNLSLGSTWVVYAGTGSVPLGTSTVAGLLKVINSLTSTDIASALSAAQGKAIYDSFSGSKTEIGHQKILGGLILQWGTVVLPAYNAGGNSAAIFTFPIEFPNLCLFADAGILNGGTPQNWGSVSAWISSVNRINATVQMGLGGTLSVLGQPSAKVFAIGY